MRTELGLEYLLGNYYSINNNIHYILAFSTKTIFENLKNVFTHAGPHPTALPHTVTGSGRNTSTECRHAFQNTASYYQDELFVQITA
jgi:hypothetical protein